LHYPATGNILAGSGTGTGYPVHPYTIAQLCRAISLQLRHVSTIGKKFVKHQYVLHMSS